MKKIAIVVTLIALTMPMLAQHVSPIQFDLTEVNLDTLRTQYSGSSYLLELQRLEKLLKDDSKALKDAQAQLKSEKETYKQLASYTKTAESSLKSLQSLSDKELAELKKFKETLEKQIKNLNANNQLSEETRTTLLEQLRSQHSSVAAAVDAAYTRQDKLGACQPQIQQMNTNLMVFNSELINKETDLKQLEATLKARKEIIKAEMKNVKAQK